jgi:small-conductance mechanosensitive channel
LDIFNREFYGNSLSTWSIALAVGIATYVALRLLRTLLVRQVNRLASRTTSGVDDVICEAIRATRWWYLATVGIWVGAMLLALPEFVRDRLGTLAILVTLAQIGIWGVVAIRSYVAGYSSRRLVDDPASVTTIRALGFLATVVVWVAVILVALDNLGIRVSAMIAGLGIGGIAIALAIQNILGDLFASLSIVLDKPFAYGDFIVVGDMAGTVEKVGVKTTRANSWSSRTPISCRAGYATTSECSSGGSRSVSASSIKRRKIRSLPCPASSGGSSRACLIHASTERTSSLSESRRWTSRWSITS